MMRHPNNRTLGEICDDVGGIIRTGPFGSQLHQSDYKEDGLPVIMPKDIIDGKVETESIARIGEEDELRLKEHKLKKGDIVFARRGDLGRCALIRERENGWLCGTGSLRVSLGDTVVDPIYLIYYFNHTDIISWIKNRAIGATLPNLNTSIIRDIPISYPSLPVQRKIADVLSAYDDLIEVNTRRIRILEQMAQSVYREWFGAETLHATSVRGKSLPEGWETGIIRDICESYSYGYTAKARTEQVGPKYLRITDIVPDYIDWENVPYCEIEEQDVDKYLRKEGDIVVARTGATTGYAKRLGKRHPKSIFASYLVRFRTNKEFSHFLLGLIVEGSEYKQFIKINLGGAAQPMANAQVLTSYPLVIPPKELQDQFDEQVQPLINLKELLQMKNAKLRRTRDLLLPRLVSGEVRVEGL